MIESIAGFKTTRLDTQHLFFTGRLPAALLPGDADFQSLWNLHPEDFHEIMIHGRLVKTPRPQQAYGRDYHYTHRSNAAHPIPSILAPLDAWAKEAIEAHLNGLLLNWYDGRLGHYIGKHRDSTTSMIPGTAIVTISLGEQRTFRVRPWKGEGFTDFAAENGTVLVLPFDANQAWTHEVPHAARYQGRRISGTLRALERPVHNPEVAGSNLAPARASGNAG